MQTKQQMPYVCDAFIFELHIGCAFNFKCITSSECIDHFTRCKQHWSRSTSCFSFF